MGLKRRRPAADAGGRTGRWFTVGFFGALLLLLGGLYAAGYALASDRIPRDVAVQGIDIGGMSPAAARTKLERELVPRADEPIVASDGGQTYEIDPAEAGLRFDVAATVESAGGGRSLNPLDMIDVLTGGEDVEPVLDVNEAALDAKIGEIAAQVQKAPTEGSIDFVGGRAEPTYPTPGRRLDELETAEAVQDRFLDAHPVLELPVRAVATQVTDKQVDRAMSRFAEPAMSAPVTLQAGGKKAKIFPAQIAPALSMEARDGRLVPQIDRKKLRRRAALPLDRVTERAKPATVVIRNGSPTVVPGEVGTGVNEKRLVKKLTPALRKSGNQRVVNLKLRKVKPEFGVKQARELQIKEVVSDFTTQFPHSDYRNTNLGQAAKNINGTVLEPGETFSFNDVVGERTEENGFTEGFIIDDGVLVEDFGGGVSQVATTTYNAAFFAGLKDLEHHPHSLYFDRYPMGREATVAWGALDLRFQNDTPHGILIQAWIEPSTPSSDGEMHVRMWSTKYWNIKAGLSDQYDFTEPEVIYKDTEDCVSQSGFGGFEVDVFRYFHRNGERVKTEKDHVTYDAANTIICEPPPSSSGSGGGNSGGGNGSSG